MKKVLWKIAAATLILTLTGCANTTAATQSENLPPQPIVENVLEDAGPVESKTVALSAGNDQLVDNTTVEGDTESEATTEPKPQPEPPAALQPQEPQASVRASVTFVPDSKKETVENSTPATSETPQDPEPEPTPTPASPAEPAPPAASEPAESTFSINYWISYAQKYARSVGLNLDSTAIDCWDNPIIAGAHCTYLERDIQSRLNRYAGDETILDVWVWAESRSDGNYDLYIGYA